MRPQTTLRTFEWTLFAAVIVTHLAAKRFILPLIPGGEYGWVAISESLQVAQAALLVTWAILGPGAWFLRLPVAALLLAVLLDSPPWDQRVPTVAQSLSALPFGQGLRWHLLVSEVGSLAFMLALVRVLGTKIERTMTPAVAACAPLKFRWSIRSLIVATAVGALLVKAGMMVHVWLDRQTVVPNWLSGGVLGLLAAAIMLLCLWTILRRSDAFYRLICVAPICGVLSYLLGVTLSGNNRDAFLAAATLFGYQALIVVATLCIVRACGFRLLTNRERVIGNSTQPVVRKSDAALSSTSSGQSRHEKLLTQV